MTARAVLIGRPIHQRRVAGRNTDHASWRYTRSHYARAKFLGDQREFRDATRPKAGAKRGRKNGPLDKEARRQGELRQAGRDARRLLLCRLDFEVLNVVERIGQRE